jgi:hypothetical protein
MRILIVLTGVAVLSACTAYPYKINPLATKEADAVETACGHRPVSKLRGSRSPREVIYSACRTETLKAMRKTEGPADAP